MKSFSCGLLVCLGTLLSAPAFAQNRNLADAERAYQAVDFPATHDAAQRALQAGSQNREHTERLYVLLGISAAAQGNSEEAKQAYVIALAIDPGFKLDKGFSPKIRDPYLEAQGYWAAASERLSLKVKPASDSEHLIVSLVDTAQLVARVEIRIGASGSAERNTYRLDTTAVSRFTLPAGLGARGYEYATRALDRNGNVLAEFGNDADPRVVRGLGATPATESPTSEVASSHRSYLLPVTLGVAGLGAAVVGVVFHVKREQAAQDWNGPQCETPGLTRHQSCRHLDSLIQNDEHLAIGFYAAGGVLIMSSLVSLVAGGSSEAAPMHAGLTGCGLLGSAVSCEGRF